jgi:uncharacterized protein YecE (DUF72 family)
MSIYVGCAGWAISSLHAPLFPLEGSHLERYAQRFPAVEINSSFYRPHRPQTYARWAASVPEQFRFAVKAPKQTTHVQRLTDASGLERFHQETRELGAKLGPWLVQLPPKLAYDAALADAFFTSLRAGFSGSVVCEPRHASWFAPEVELFLSTHQVARVAADPALCPAAAKPGGWDGLAYYRLHGSPRMYYSAYSPLYLAALAREINTVAARSIPVWCIFDNTARGAATTDALALIALLTAAP